MTELRKAAEDLLEVVEAAIKAGDWKVDGACDLDLAIVRLRQALAQPEEKMHIEGNGKLTTKPYPDGYESEQQFRKALAQREWVGLTRRELDIATLGLEDLSDCYKAIEAKLKEKNT